MISEVDKEVREILERYPVGNDAYHKFHSSYWEDQYVTAYVRLRVAVIIMIGSLLANAWMASLLKGCVT